MKGAAKFRGADAGAMWKERWAIYTMMYPRYTQTVFFVDVE